MSTGRRELAIWVVVIVLLLVDGAVYLRRSSGGGRAPAPRSAHGKPAGHRATTRATPAPARRTRPAKGRPTLRDAGRQGATLVVDAVRGPCWIVARSGSADGALLYHGTLQQGYSVELQGGRLWAQFGAVSNVDVRIGGRLVRLGAAALHGVFVSASGVRPASPADLPIVGS